MWEILFGYGIEKVFSRRTAAFEIGGHIVQTSVPGDATPQAVGKATLEPSTDVVTDPSLVCYAPEPVVHRHGIQLGFNPFTPVIVEGARILIEKIGYDSSGVDERQY